MTATLIEPGSRPLRLPAAEMVRGRRPTPDEVLDGIRRYHALGPRTFRPGKQTVTLVGASINELSRHLGYYSEKVTPVVADLVAQGRVVRVQCASYGCLVPADGAP